MNRTYISAAVVALVGIALAAASLLQPDAVGLIGLVLASAAMPTAVLLVVIGKLGRKVPVVALISGGTLAVGMSLAGYAIVGGAAYFVLGDFAEWLVDSGDGLIDADLMRSIRDPWMILLAIDLIVLAPLIEEFSKAVGARLARPSDRTSAVLAGVSAGVGFAWSRMTTAAKLVSGSPSWRTSCTPREASLISEGGRWWPSFGCSARRFTLLRLDS